MTNEHKILFSLPEIKGWLSTLDGLRQENIVLKNRLSDAVRQSSSRSFIENAELLQQWSIDKDQLIDILRHDISSLLTKIHFSGDAGTRFQQQAHALAVDVQKVVSGFNEMKLSFDNCMDGSDH